MIRILLADDQRLMCDGLKSMLETKEDIMVVGIASNGEEAVSLAAKTFADLVLLDIRMPRMNGIEAVLRLKRQFENIKVVMLTTFNDEEYILEAMANGADGYLLKDMDTPDLLNAVYNTMNDHMVMPSVVAKKLREGLAGIRKLKEGQKKLKALGFTSRETEIAKMISQGFNNSQIATALYLSDGTIRNYLSSIYNKLGVSDKAGAIVKLKDTGL